MVAFILVPTFAISAFLLGAFPAANAAPHPEGLRDSAALVNRGCHQIGCLATTSGSSSQSSTSTPAAALATGSPSPTSGTEASDAAEDAPDSIGAVARALGAARPYTGVLSAAAHEEASTNQV